MNKWFTADPAGRMFLPSSLDTLREGGPQIALAEAAEAHPERVGRRPVRNSQ
jgi:hypothetical protein